MLGCIGSLSPQLNYAIDLLNYEKQFYFLLHRDCLPKRRSNSSIEIQPGDKLIHSKFIEFVKVEHDVPEIIYSLKKSSESMKYLQASKFYVGSAWLVFKRIYLDESEPEVLFISNETKTVIELCTGLDTAKSISQKVRQQLYYRGEDKDIYNILDRLLARDCIEFMGKETPA